MRSKIEKLKPALSLGVSAFISILILRLLLSSIGQIENHATIRDLLTSIFFYGVYFYGRALSWSFILRSLSSKVTDEGSLFAFFSGESARYIPGNIWSFAGRYYLTRKMKVPRATVILSMVVEIGLLLLVTTLLSLPALVVNLQRLNSIFLLILLAIILLVSILAKVFLGKIKSYFKQLESLPKGFIFTKAFLLGVLFQIIAWINFSLATYILFKNLGNTPPLLALSAPVTAWLLGYLSFITPMGLGIREGALIALLSPYIGTGQAALVAVLSRVTLIIAEVLNLSFWLYLFQKDKLNKAFKRIFFHWDLFILISLVLLYTGVFSLLSILRHDAFASSFDLANMGQTVWNTLHGRPFALSGAESTVSRFSIHADIVLALLSPLYLIWDNVRVLLVTQSAALGLGAIPVYLLAKKVLGKITDGAILKFVSLGLVLIYLLNPSMEWTNLYDFHGVALSIPLLLTSFYFAYTASGKSSSQEIRNKQWLWYWVFIFLSLTTKEEVGLIVAMMGLMIFFIFKEKMVGTLTILTGISWFLITVFTLIPHFSSGGQHWGIEALYQPATQKVEEAKSLIQYLDIFRGYFLETPAREYYIALLRPFSFIPILGLPWLLLSLPEFVINLLSSNAFMVSTTLHYDSGITPFLIIAMIFGLYYLVRILGVRVPKLQPFILSAVTLIALIVAIRVNYHYSPLPTTPSCWCLVYQVTGEDIQFERVLRSIPKDASITASSEVRAHLTRRENSYNLPSKVDSADYVAILDQNRVIGDYSPKGFEEGLLNDPHFLSSHSLVSHIGHFYLYKRI